ncbi:hypothetical protein J2W39_004935 [Variovorax paradoxus]|uniref:DUF2523 domain-containing protein n=1 Tax=Variovorax paradoxus TaxID=34073 RepID=A0AAW8ELI1_VARPD|nr:DUF2523 family protein [Variovorax paradoxus]MDP9973676.1 hypothetical protein [Variovorax paradoxus]
MAAAFTMLLAKIAAVLVWIGQLFVKCWVAVWDLVRDAACWPFEQVMKIAVKAVSAIDLSGIQPYTSMAGGLPGEIVNIMGLLGIGTCCAIIAAAIAIRLILQLIPFTRLGS